MREDSARLWWEEITGPSRLVREIAGALLEANCVLLQVPGDLPWRSRMRTAVEGVLREADRNLLVDYIDCAAERDGAAGAAIDVPGFLLSRYAPPEVKSGYRVSSGQSIHRYIQERDVLKNRVIWVKGMTAGDERSWLDFCRSYRPRSCGDGLFVIESYGEDLRAAGVRTMRYAGRVSRYDALLFNSMMVSLGRNAGDSLERKQYIAAAASLLCGKDVELSEMLLEEADLAAECPIEALCRVARMPYFSRRMGADTLEETHPFALIRSGRAKEMEHVLWKAQLQALFPLLEMERISFVERYEEEIRRGLAMRYWDFDRGAAYRVRQYSEYIDDPRDAELGTLYRMNHLRQAEDQSLYLLFLESGDRERLDLICHMRNKLAHSRVCPAEETARFLETYPYEWRGVR